MSACNQPRHCTPSETCSWYRWHCSSNDLPGYCHHKVTLRFKCLVGLCVPLPTHRRFYSMLFLFIHQTSQRRPNSLLTLTINCLILCSTITITFYINFFMTDTTIPYIMLENVHTIALYQTKLDSYQNVLS